jgi:hypothetical protein
MPSPHWDGPGFLTTTEDGCRWRLHIRAKGVAPFDTVHEFQWIGYESAPAEVQSDWGDLDEDDDAEEEFEVVSMALPGFPPLPAKRLPPLEFEDDFFEAYSDDFDDSDEYDGEEGEYGEASPLAYIAACYSESAIPLPDAMLAELAGCPEDEVYPRFLALHGAYIADALARFSIPHDRVEVLRILTGQNLSEGERESDVGNLWRFLHHVGLGPKFAEALEEFERVEAPQAPEDPALGIIRATGKLPLRELEGAPARVPLNALLLMARLTYYQDTYPAYAVCVRFDSAVDWPACKTPSYTTCTPVKKGFGVNITLDGMNTAILPRARQRLGELFASLPSGARLELLGKGEYARTRLAGRVADGAWLIESASAPMSAEDVGWMLELFRAAESRRAPDRAGRIRSGGRSPRRGPSHGALQRSAAPGGIAALSR